ncbi:lipopolysaccharide assembly protein LapA domain-containing protein [Rhodococcus kronopolitis]|uniref:Lipopolysaccharide assembly protein LapA domain-containing protein n=1 Tax=Rhodococcus kronopolitis TaxID=1460226 RepID=A0ABV9FQE1_9NOCA
MAQTEGPGPDPRHGPTDNTPDPAPVTPEPVVEREPGVTPEQAALDRHTSLGHTKAAATWTGLVIGALVLVLLLVFILQNLDQVTLNLFLWEFSLPLGVSLLLAAIAGALIMALAGGVRIVQIRRVAKRSRSAAH